MFCKNCGNKVEKEVAFCPSCGTPLNEDKKKAGKQEQPQVVYAPYPMKEPGKGTGTAGMILGIIAIAYAMLTLITMFTDDFKETISDYTSSDLVPFAIGVVLIQTVLACVGLPLSISSMRKKKSGKNVMGMIMCTITLILSVVYFIYLLATYS